MSQTNIHSCQLLYCCSPSLRLSRPASRKSSAHADDAPGARRHLNGQARCLGAFPPLEPCSWMSFCLCAIRLDSTRSSPCLQNPSSPGYRQFLTPAEFTARFGPTQQDYDAVVQLRQSHGLTVVGGSRDGMDVQVKGPVSAIESAFHVNMRYYQHPTREPHLLRAQTASPPWTCPSSSGTSRDSTTTPSRIRCMSRRATTPQRMASIPKDVVSHATTGSGPSASFLGSDMRAAYYGGTALTGAGQNLGLFEYLGTDLADLNTYYTNVGPDQQRAHHAVVHRWHQHKLRLPERTATTPSRRST